MIATTQPTTNIEINNHTKTLYKITHKKTLEGYLIKCPKCGEELDIVDTPFNIKSEYICPKCGTAPQDDDVTIKRLYNYQLPDTEFIIKYNNPKTKEKDSIQIEIYNQSNKGIITLGAKEITTEEIKQIEVKESEEEYNIIVTTITDEITKITIKKIPEKREFRLGHIHYIDYFYNILINDKVEDKIMTTEPTMNIKIYKIPC